VLPSFDRLPRSRDSFLRPGFPKLKRHHLDATSSAMTAPCMESDGVSASTRQVLAHFFGAVGTRATVLATGGGEQAVPVGRCHMDGRPGLEWATPALRQAIA
jgi:hypothetical protein